MIPHTSPYLRPAAFRWVAACVHGSDGSTVTRNGLTARDALASAIAVMVADGRANVTGAALTLPGHAPVMLTGPEARAAANAGPASDFAKSFPIPE